jgi:predicted RNA-binding protein with RPS1 domain
MGGGEGAKERRLLKRRQAIAGGGNTTFGQIPSLPKSLSKETRSNKTSKSVHGRTQTKFSPTANQSLKKRTKVKKPKHLKRKLDEADAQVDDAAREKLQWELEEWERKKMLHAGNQNKKQRLRHASSQYSVARTLENQVKPKDRVEYRQQAEPRAIIFTKRDDNLQNDTQNKSGDSKSQLNVNDPNGSSVEGTTKARTEQDTTTDNKRSSSTLHEKLTDSDDDDKSNEPIARRQRGKRRRGRKDTSKKIAEFETIAEKQKLQLEHQRSDSAMSLSKTLAHDGTEPSRNRYCIGRKPVTDFVIGQTYAGKVVYVKPFGIFLDIGCHSDAFCHVSRLSDDFVDSPDSVFREGDSVSNIRVMEIDRNRKRITVSLQTEARVEDERASIEARKRRKETREAKSGKKKGRSRDRPVIERVERIKSVHEQIPKNEEQNVTRPPIPVKDPSTMTPLELKRARKLARRAARREQAEDGALVST